MFKLQDPVNHWGTDQFESSLKEDLGRRELSDFKLENDISYTGFFVENSLSFSILSSKIRAKQIEVLLGIYFQEYMTTCPCSGDETELSNGYCERILLIDTGNASAEIQSI